MSTLTETAAKSQNISLRWDVFKPSGKWQYGGEVAISGIHPIWKPNELLAEIDALKDQIHKGIITRREYTLVIRETDDQGNDPDYHGFYTRLFSAVI